MLSAEGCLLHFESDIIIKTNHFYNNLLVNKIHIDLFSLNNANKKSLLYLNSE